MKPKERMTLKQDALKATGKRYRKNQVNDANDTKVANPIKIINAQTDNSVLTLTFDRQVALGRGVVPQITTDVDSAEPVSAELTAPNVVAITFSRDISSATVLNIPFRDPAIRNSSGGYVISNTFPLAA